MEFLKSDEDTLLLHWSNFWLWPLGKTGNSFVDTMMKELFFTGEISNRAGSARPVISSMTFMSHGGGELSGLSIY
jgi:deoxyribodipyrimidine photolyase